MFLHVIFVVKKTNALISFQENRPLASMEDWIFLIQNLKNDRLFLIPEVGIVMSAHIDRSMANNAKVINARIEAMKFLIKNEKFPSEEKNLIKGYSYNFCAIHSYLDFNRYEALTYFNKFIKIRGLGIKMLLMGLKYLIGRKVIDKIPRGRVSSIRTILTKELIEN